MSCANVNMVQVRVSYRHLTWRMTKIMFLFKIHVHILFFAINTLLVQRFSILSCLSRCRKSITESTIFTYFKLALTNTGRPPKAGTASSIILWPLTKLSVDSGRFCESAEHRPGLGCGSFILTTGNQFEFAVSCSLNAPSNVSNRSLNLNAQIALPAIELAGVVKTA